MRVSIDRSACGGTGLCAELCPAVFAQDPDYVAYVKDAGERVDGDGAAVVPEEFRDDAREAAESCPTSAVVVRDD